MAEMIDHGGFIKADSLESEGSVFEVTLPATHPMKENFHGKSIQSSVDMNRIICLPRRTSGFRNMHLFARLTDYLVSMEI
jgi:hypothetical protein